MTISQGSVATRVKCDGLFNNYYKFTAKSTGERILKIKQYLVELQVRIRCLAFCGTQCSYHSCDSENPHNNRLYGTPCSDKEGSRDKMPANTIKVQSVITSVSESQDRLIMIGLLVDPGIHGH